ncbi:MAG: exodeoxyribonuclease VII small subunit [Bacteroidales bacterium]|nr:exodeoxyribonuclease VII small subunit [Bacteroidales bacterium]MBN2757998.1 exodeoxyribonuclease VII small subunit [Bacteroidales bacterium]
MTKKNFSYKNAISEIEEIMDKLENKELDLDELSENVKKASELINKCKDKLHNTENEIDEILNKMQS